METALFRSLLYWTLVIMTTPSSHATTLGTQYASTLMEFSKGWGYPSLLTNWNGTDPCGKSWTGLSCSSGVITSLSIGITANGVVRKIPLQLSVMTDLVALAIYSSGLSGPIPTNLSTLVKLTSLRLNENALTGTYPKQFSTFVALQSLQIQGNQLRGPFPLAWLSYTAITEIYASDNLFTGNLPASLSSVSAHLNYLYLYGNSFNGSLNPLVSLTSMAEMGLGKNQFTGTLPILLTKLSNLESLYFDNNLLSGSLPSQYEGAWSLMIDCTVCLTLTYNAAMCGGTLEGYGDQPGTGLGSPCQKSPPPSPPPPR